MWFLPLQCANYSFCFLSHFLGPRLLESRCFYLLLYFVPRIPPGCWHGTATLCWRKEFYASFGLPPMYTSGVIPISDWPGSALEMWSMIYMILRTRFWCSWLRLLPDFIALLGSGSREGPGAVAHCPGVCTHREYLLGGWPPYWHFCPTKAPPSFLTVIFLLRCLRCQHLLTVTKFSAGHISWPQEERPGR